MNTAGRKRRHLRRWLLEIAAILLLLLAINAWHARGTPHGTAPAFEGTLLDGTPVSLAGFRGKPVLLHFWATWCPICGLEQGTIDAIARDYPVLGVAMDEATAQEIRTYLNEKGVDYPVLHDPDLAIARLYSIRGIPTSFILDAAGRIRFVEVGFTTAIGFRLRIWWAGLNWEFG